VLQQGTGLGLSISHDIIVKQHGGSIEVETQPGEFTEDQGYPAARRCVGLTSAPCPLLTQSGHALVRRIYSLLIQSEHSAK